MLISVVRVRREHQDDESKEDEKAIQKDNSRI